MPVLVNKHTKVITQCVTGATGTLDAGQVLAYGTHVVADVALACQE